MATDKELIGVEFKVISIAGDEYGAYVSNADP